MIVVSGLMLAQIRDNIWRASNQASDYLVRTIEQNIAQNIRLYDLSLQGVIEDLSTPDIRSASPKLRNLALFDRAASANDKGVMLVLDENGDIIDDMEQIPPRKANYADREYFQVHKSKGYVGLFISKPFVSRLTGLPVLALSRRINKPDGSFGGVVVGTLKLEYFNHLFAHLGLGREYAINLFLEDGTRIARFPYVKGDIGATIAGSPTLMEFLREEQGSFTAVSVRDQVERLYVFRRLEEFPLILNVAASTDAIEKSWRAEAFTIGLATLFLCGSTIGLVFWVAREFRRRVATEAELAKLSATDGLTGVPNRRRFDEELPSVCSSAQRGGNPLSLMIVDADHFKRINDHFGHQAGDEVLKIIARCLTAVVHRDGDLAFRIGGEEFAMLLPDTDIKGAWQVADKVHERIRNVRTWPRGISSGMVTVSIGIACLHRAEPGIGSEEVYRAADVALYKAKTEGRNRTCCDAAEVNIKRMQATPLRVVNG